MVSVKPSSKYIQCFGKEVVHAAEERRVFTFKRLRQQRIWLVFHCNTLNEKAANYVYIVNSIHVLSEENV